MNKTEEFIFSQYHKAHNPETGKPMSRRQLGLLTRQLRNKGFTDPEILLWILYFDTLGQPVTQRAACKWMCNAFIILPEDEDKVHEAVKVAKINHVDPLQYESPMSIINCFSRLNKRGKAIDPSTVSTLHFRYHNPTQDIDVYDVDEGIESRKNLRAIINSHLGIRSNPWCLLLADKNGNLSWYSQRFWNRYHGLKKRVAFQHGRLYAFSAGQRHPRTWYDRMDQPHQGEKIEYLRIENDPLRRTGQFRVDPFTGEKELLGDIHRGNKINGWFERFHFLRSKKPYSREFLWNGKPVNMTWNWLTKDQLDELLQASDLEKGIIRIPPTVKAIPDRAFCFAEALREIHLPDSVEHLGEHLFEGCRNLRVVHLPSGVSTLPDGIFKDCRSLAVISIPKKVHEIGANAFSHCVSLKKILIPNKVTTIGNGAFTSCRSLSEISFPSSVTAIGKGAFAGCTFTEVTIPETVRSLSAGAFSMCMNIHTFYVCKRWYGMFHDRYGRRVQLFPDTEKTIYQSA